MAELCTTVKTMSVKLGEFYNKIESKLNSIEKQMQAQAQSLLSSVHLGPQHNPSPSLAPNTNPNSNSNTMLSQLKKHGTQQTNTKAKLDSNHSLLVDPGSVSHNSNAEAIGQMHSHSVSESKLDLVLEAVSSMRKAMSHAIDTQKNIKIRSEHDLHREVNMDSIKD